MRARRAIYITVLCLTALVACGEDEVASDAAGLDPMGLSGVKGAVEPSDVPVSPIEIPVEGELRDLSSAGWHVYVGTDLGLQTLDATDGALPVTFLPDSDDAATTEGAIVAMGESETKVVVAGDGGLFHTQGWALLRSPSSGSLEDLELLDLAVGDDDTLWIVAEEGLYRLDESGLASITYEGLDAPRRVATHGARALVAGASSAHVIDGNNWEVQPREVLGTIHDMSSWSEGFLIAGSDGLYAEHQGAWNRYLLSEGAPVHVAAVDGRGDRAVAATSVGLVELGLEGVRGLTEILDLSAVEHLALDVHGHAWTAISSTDGALASYWPVGTPPSFEAEVRNYFVTHCHWCHGEGTQGAPRRDFTDYEVVISMLDPIMERIALGLMPPASTGMILTEDNEELLARWIDGGLAP